MNRPLFALIFIAIIAIIFVGMWLGWRARSRRDHHVGTAHPAFTGTEIAQFQRVLYVSTTPVGEPLTRVAAPGLRYRGYSAVTVFTDGVEIQVTGEHPVRIETAQVNGTSHARVRVGKAVERNGLTLLLWSDAGHDYESSFRFDTVTAEREFTTAIAKIAPLSEHADSASLENNNFPHITQEDAR